MLVVLTRSKRNEWTKIGPTVGGIKMNSKTSAMLMDVLWAMMFTKYVGENLDDQNWQFLLLSSPTVVCRLL